MTPQSKKKICFITGTRAEYGLLYPLLKRIKNDRFFTLQIIATGMHLSPEFGLTYREIEKDGFTVDDRVEMLLSSDTDAGVSKSVGIGIISFADIFKKQVPDMLVVTGDRFETFAATVSAFIAGIPVAHLHGGELSEGVIDDAMRHSITKMSYLHFTSTETYRKRVIQLGESPERVFNVGALGIDNIKETGLLEKDELEDLLNFKFDGKTALVTYHPVTLEYGTQGRQFRELLKALQDMDELKIIFTKPNADRGGREIAGLMDEFQGNHPGKTVSFTSLGRLKYLSVMKYVDVVVGNSSSGIIESPAFKKPAVNIGDRQRGRIKAESIIDCRCAREDITAAVRKALSPDFQILCRNIRNPYGTGGASGRIAAILKEILSGPINLKKGFFDIRNVSEDEIRRAETADTGEPADAERYIHC